MKKFLLIAFGIICVFVAGYYYINSSDQTQYIQTKDSNRHLMQTRFFRMETPNTWRHEFGGVGCYGDPFGSILTEDGVINYEYGPTLNVNDSLNNTNFREVAAGRFKVFLFKNNNGESGISIRPQFELDYTFSLIPDKAVNNNIDELLRSFETLEFVSSRTMFRQGDTLNN